MIHIVIVHSRRYQIPFRMFVLNPVSQIRAVETWFDEYKVGRLTRFFAREFDHEQWEFHPSRR